MQSSTKFLEVGHYSLKESKCSLQQLQQLVNKDNKTFCKEEIMPLDVLKHKEFSICNFCKDFVNDNKVLKYLPDKGDRPV